MQKPLQIFFALLLVVFGMFSLGTVSAQCDDPNDPLGVECGAASGLGGGDVRQTVTRVINVILGLLGTISVCLIMYAGFKWMTAGGNEENVAAAKKIIAASVVGLAIILSAYAVNRFVLTRLYEATTSTRIVP